MIPLFRLLGNVTEEELEQDVANCPLSHARIMIFTKSYFVVCEEEHEEILTITVSLN